MVVLVMVYFFQMILLVFRVQGFVDNLFNGVYGLNYLSMMCGFVYIVVVVFDLKEDVVDLSEFVLIGVKVILVVYGYCYLLYCIFIEFFCSIVFVEYMRLLLVRVFIY